MHSTHLKGNIPITRCTALQTVFLCVNAKRAVCLAQINCNYIAYSLQLPITNIREAVNIVCCSFAAADGYKEFCCPSPPYFNLLNSSTSPSVEVVGEPREPLQHISFSLLPLPLTSTVCFSFPERYRSPLTAAYSKPQGIAF